MNNGYIKLWRKVKDHRFWLQKRKYSNFEAWIDILLKVNHHENTFHLGDREFKVMPGETITSQLKLSKRWGWSLGKVNLFLKRLQNENEIKLICENKFTKIVVNKWSHYQPKHENKMKTKRKQNENKMKQLDNDKNDNKNDKEVKGKKFTPPTLEEVQAYIKEKKYNIDANTWIDHYISNGWMVGKNKMKDWKAAVRTWSKNKYGNNPQIKLGGKDFDNLTITDF